MTNVDPDQTLTAIRNARRILLDNAHGGLTDDRWHDLTLQLARLFGVLDDYLCTGGYLPREWEDAEAEPQFEEPPEGYEDDLWRKAPPREVTVDVKGELL